MRDKTLIVDGRQAPQEEEFDNSATQVRPLGLCPPPFPEAFELAYPKLRHLTAEAHAPGLAVAAVDDTGLLATAYLRSKRETATSLVVGRHRRVDIYLGHDPLLSLRHLLAVLLPQPEGADLRFRLMDLRTSVGFLDEHGRKLQALEAEGPMFVSCGRHALFVLTSGSFGGSWPEDAVEAWRRLPERVYFDGKEAAPLASPAGARRAFPRDPRDPVTPAHGVPSPLDATPVTVLPPPVEAAENLLSEGEEPAGCLRYTSGGRQGELILGPSALGRGLLFGRYARCDGRGVLFGDFGLSRVHLLLIELAGVLYAIDTGSTNGVSHGGERRRLVRMDHGTTIALGISGTALEWTAVS